jgi:hypothetical protein
MHAEDVFTVYNSRLDQSYYMHYLNDPRNLPTYLDFLYYASQDTVNDQTDIQPE